MVDITLCGDWAGVPSLYQPVCGGDGQADGCVSVLLSPLTLLCILTLKLALLLRTVHQLSNQRWLTQV